MSQKSKVSGGGLKAPVAPASTATTSGAEADTKDLDGDVVGRVSMLKKMMSANPGRKGAGREMKFNLVSSYSSTSGAAAAQAPLVPIRPGAATEWATISPLFDEVIVDAVTVHMRSYLTSPAQTAGCDWAVAYDPSNTGVYVSVNGVLEAEQHFGPAALAGAPGCTGITAFPSAVTKTGFYKWKVKMPKGPHVHDPNVLSVISTGEWSSTSVNTSTYGNLKFYVEAPQAGASAMTGHMVLHCRFRVRS
jgi:hypothetical protein